MEGSRDKEKSGRFSNRGTGRKKIQIKRRVKQSHLNVTFSKRRDGIYNKARALCKLCGVEVAVIIFSPSGRLYTFAHPCLESVIQKFKKTVECSSPLPLGDGDISLESSMIQKLEQSVDYPTSNSDRYLVIEKFKKPVECSTPNGSHDVECSSPIGTPNGSHDVECSSPIGDSSAFIGDVKNLPDERVFLCHDELIEAMEIDELVQYKLELETVKADLIGRILKLKVANAATQTSSNNAHES